MGSSSLYPPFISRVGQFGRGTTTVRGLTITMAINHVIILHGMILQVADLGQVEGHILDCAFSLSFDPMHDELGKLGERTSWKCWVGQSKGD